MAGYISKEGLHNLANWKYKSGTYTYCDDFLNPFWIWGATFFPKWIAPNMISLIGLLFAVIATAITLLYDTSLEGEVPPWLYILGAFAVFMFQTFDAIDGKHARNTGQSSPLGQLFDHGCDAVNCLLTFFLYFQGARLGITRLSMLPMFIAGTSCFYTA